jgi:hypothetical protein
VPKGDDLTTFIVPKVMKNPEALTFRMPSGLFRPAAGKLYLYDPPVVCSIRFDGVFSQYDSTYLIDLILLVALGPWGRLSL